jgi:hypothetical protein
MGLEMAGVRLTAEMGLATILGDSEDGLGIQDIAEKTGVDSLKLGSLHTQTEKNKLTCLCRTRSSSFSYPRLVP